MPTTVTVYPNFNVTPDPGFGGNNVSNISNTGHDNSTSSAFSTSADVTQTKSARWGPFDNLPAGTPTSVTLKFTRVLSGSVNGGETGFADNLYQVQYSIDSGNNWTNIETDLGVTSSINGELTVSLSTSQAMSTVRVRDKGFAEADGSIGDAASANIVFSMSNIRIEAVFPDVVSSNKGNPITMM